MCVCVFLHSHFLFHLLFSIGLISLSLSALRMQMKLFQLLCLQRVYFFPSLYNIVYNLMLLLLYWLFCCCSCWRLSFGAFKHRTNSYTNTWYFMNHMCSVTVVADTICCLLSVDDVYVLRIVKIFIYTKSVWRVNGKKTSRVDVWYDIVYSILYYKTWMLLSECVREFCLKLFFFRC